MLWACCEENISETEILQSLGFRVLVIYFRDHLRASSELRMMDIVGYNFVNADAVIRLYGSIFANFNNSGQNVFLRNILKVFLHVFMF